MSSEYLSSKIGIAIIETAQITANEGFRFRSSSSQPMEGQNIQINSKNQIRT